MADASANTQPINRPAVTLCVILAVIMQALDTTIANVALPYMQGSVSASADQINWVLTSYIVAAAIMTPPSGFLANRFGRKRVLMAAVVGFVVASVRCAALRNRWSRSWLSDCCKASSARRSFRSASPFCSTSIRRKNAGRRWPCSAYR